MMLSVFVTVVSWTSLSNNAYAQYSDDLNDIWHVSVLPEPGEYEPTPIGNLGRIDVVVDLRGFVPMSFYSHAVVKEGPKITLDPLPFDALRWYKIPTRKALLMLYSGDLKKNIASDTTSLERAQFSNAAFLAESDVKNKELQSWCKIAYTMAKHSEPLYERIAGSGFEEAEPTTVFLTDKSVFVILSFRYNSVLRRRSTGQVLVALEFSSSSREYRTFYQVYATLFTNKATANAATQAAKELAGQALKAIF